MTRRDVIAGAGGLLAMPALSSTVGAADADGDVVVIGAGAAGLAAAADLRAAGFAVVLIESRDRIGGRVWTTDILGRSFDAGAAFVHFRDRNPWVAIARDLGVPLQEHRGFGQGRAFDGPTPLDAAALEARADGRRRLWRLFEAFDTQGRDTSLGELPDGAGRYARLAAMRYGQQAIGEEPGEISVVDLLNQWEGGDYTVPGGYGRLVEASGSGLQVSLATPATTVRWDGGGVAVETPRGTVRAARAVVTLPTGVLAAGRVRFVPELPGETLSAIGDLRPGALTKVALALDGERFGLASPSDLFETRSGFVFELFPFGRDLVLATIGGAPARDLVRLGEAGAVAAATDRLADMLGGEVRSHVIGGRLADWWSDPHALGSYSIARPGRFAARAALGRPVGDRLHFAGEATGGGGSMTAGGATLAGRAAAAAIIAALRPGAATAR
jgi:monoamine oxidase